jgi:phosphoserine phosphatase
VTDRARTRARLLVVLDVDSTLIEQEVIDLLAARAGAGDRVAEITDRAMRGELDFAASLEERVALLQGLPVGVLAEVGAELRLTTGARELTDAVHAAGGLVAAVSGGFHELLDPLADRLGLDRWRANRLGVADARLTGRVEGPVIDAAAKAEALREWADEAGVPAGRTVAIGDGANDVRMMRAAGLAVAFCAKPAARAAADVVLDTRDLALVLPLLGLR